MTEKDLKIYGTTFTHYSLSIILNFAKINIFAAKELLNNKTRPSGNHPCLTVCDTAVRKTVSTSENTDVHAYLLYENTPLQPLWRILSYRDT